jgi:hypothetical protein
MKLIVKKEEYANLYRLYLDCKSLIECKDKGEGYEFMEKHILEKHILKRMETNLKRYEDDK